MKRKEQTETVLVDQSVQYGADPCIDKLSVINVTWQRKKKEKTETLEPRSIFALTAVGDNVHAARAANAASHRLIFATDGSSLHMYG